ncbi:MAG: hypothetical protein U0Y68_02090 [Blastocatellia bacterium]
MMKRITIFLSLVCLLTYVVLAQTPPPAKGKDKKSKTFDPPKEPVHGIPVAGSTFAIEGAPPPPAQTYPLNVWQPRTFAQDSFAAAFPTAPGETVKVDKYGGNDIASKTYKVATLDGTYSVTVTPLPTPSPEPKASRQERLRAMLKQLEKGPYEWLGGKEIEVEGQPGVEFRYRVPQLGQISWQRFIAADTGMYRVIAETLADKPALKEPQLFMESFKLLPPSDATPHRRPPRQDLLSSACPAVFCRAMPSERYNPSIRQKPRRRGQQVRASRHYGGRRRPRNFG